MKIRKYFGFCNLIMLLVSITLICAATLAFIVIFIMKFPVEELYVTRAALLQPVVLVETMGSFFRGNPLAFGYVLLWAAVCIAILSATTTIMTKRMSQRITRSLYEVVKAAERVQGGDKSFEMIGSDMQEIDELCTGFDDMRRSLLSAQKREEALKHERSMLIANISHDLKTPVTAIKGYIDAINDGLADDPKKLAHYLKVIKSKNNTIENLVNNLSTMSRLELSKLEMDKSVGELNDLLYEAEQEHIIDAELAGLEIVTELADKSIPVNIDYDKMKRVFSNLLENAVKYRKSDSKRIVISSEIKDSCAYAYVIDDGMGICADEMPKIYDSFYRVDDARASQTKGSGLGLGIARQIVQKHGGRLWLTSEGVGRGTTAVVSLPLYGRT